MAKLVLPSLRKQAFFSICFPFLGVMVLSAASMIFSVKIGCSLWTGGMIWIISHGYVAARLFKRVETDPARFLGLFYKSEIIKLTVIALLFILIVKWTTASFIFLITGYLCAQIFFGIYFFLEQINE